MKIKNLRDLGYAKKSGIKLRHPPQPRIMVGVATCGLAVGAQEVFDAIAEEVKKHNLDIMLVPTGCLGYCQKEPLVEVLEPGKPGIIYAYMTAEKARQVISALVKGQIVKDWALAKIEEEEYLMEGKIWKYPLNKASADFADIPLYNELPFWKKQRKIILRNSGFIDAGSLEEYIERGGYFGLYKALAELTPEEVISEVTSSGLRGRGGAGFPTGRKWQSCHDAAGSPKYVICNADEGNPGAYMDRTVLEGDPHTILEGMAIGAYAIGATKGYIYVRDEYPLAVKSMRRAVAQAQERGLLGDGIMSSKFDFDVEIVRGARAFVCGEETALIASIEGEIGEPKARPPFPTQNGLRGKPTVINNVKTWSTIAPIISRGSTWYSQIGTEISKGTTVFSLVGRIENNGLVEVPLGTTLREMIYDIGGGIPDGKAFKAIQTGGPSGGCIPASLIDLPIDYETLAQAGSSMGAGGMVVLDEDSCMVDIAHFFLTFTMNESCGKCIPCREGIKQMYNLVSNIVTGKGREHDIELLEELGQIIRDSSLCALGGSATNPVLTTIKYFRDEYEAHIIDKICPTASCPALLKAP